MPKISRKKNQIKYTDEKFEVNIEIQPIFKGLGAYGTIFIGKNKNNEWKILCIKNNFTLLHTDVMPTYIKAYATELEDKWVNKVFNNQKLYVII